MAANNTTIEPKTNNDGEYLVEPWDVKDSLREMTIKFNTAVSALLQLKENSEGVSEGTEQRLNTLTEQLNQSINELQTAIDQKVDNVTKDDLGLGNVDNTADVDKPVSAAQQEAIDNAVSEMIQSTPAADGELDTEEMYDPEVSTPVKNYIEKRLVELLGTPVNYNIANADELGVVKSGDTVYVSPTTGKMSVPALGLITQNISNITTALKALTESLESNNHAVSLLGEQVASLSNTIGDTSQLNTATTDTIVNAINEVNEHQDDTAQKVETLERQMAEIWG